MKGKGKHQYTVSVKALLAVTVKADTPDEAAYLADSREIPWSDFDVVRYSIDEIELVDD